MSPWACAGVAAISFLAGRRYCAWEVKEAFEAMHAKKQEDERRALRSPSWQPTLEGLTDLVAQASPAAVAKVTVRRELTRAWIRSDRFIFFHDRLVLALRLFWAAVR